MRITGINGPHSILYISERNELHSSYVHTCVFFLSFFFPSAHNFPSRHPAPIFKRVVTFPGSISDSVSCVGMVIFYFRFLNNWVIYNRKVPKCSQNINISSFLRAGNTFWPVLNIFFFFLVIYSNFKLSSFYFIFFYNFFLILFE